MTKIIYDDRYCGFCMGVRNAIELAKQAVTDNNAVYCLGQIVHNQLVVDDLASRGILTVNDASEIPAGSTVVVRAHGVSPEVAQQLEIKGCRIVDATCRFVKHIHKQASHYYSLGYNIILMGDSCHPEIIGINGHCNNSAVVCSDWQQISLEKDKKYAILFQTTYDSEKFENCLQNISNNSAKTLEIIKTICYTTRDRQSYAHFVSKQCDAVVLIGDSNSSNTNKLYDIIKQQCNNVIWVNYSFVPNCDWNAYQNIGIITGASTPDELIQGVITSMSTNAKETVVSQNDKALFENAVEQIVKPTYRVGNRVQGRITSINEAGLSVRLESMKTEATVPNEELALGDYQQLKDTLKVDDMIDCIVISVEKGITLSHKEIEARAKDDELIATIADGTPFEVTIERAGNNSLIGKLGGYTVIIHASQIRMGFVKSVEPFVGKTLRVVTSEDKINAGKRTIHASAKTLLMAEKKEKEDAFWNNIEVNEIVEGKVERFADFGAFVSVKGFDCLAHSADLSWTRVGHPSEVLAKGETYEFVVLDLNREKNRVSLGYKQLQPKPWDLAAEKYAVGTVVTGKVARILDFGAFVQLEKGIDGLIHISNVSWEWLEDINKELKVGDEVQAEVIEFDAATKRITLSRKACMPNNAKHDDNEGDAE